MADKTLDYEESLRAEKIVEDDDEEEEEEDDELQGWDDWQEEEEGGDGEEDFGLAFACLFCDSTFGQANAVFDHCVSSHHFDFRAIRRALSLDFYASFKLINYVRSQVNPWTCSNFFDCLLAVREI